MIHFRQVLETVGKLSTDFYDISKEIFSGKHEFLTSRLKFKFIEIDPRVAFLSFYLQLI